MTEPSQIVSGVIEADMTPNQIRQWIEACNHEPARDVLRHYLRLTTPTPEPSSRAELVARAMCDVDWDMTQPWDRKPQSFRDRYLAMAEAAVSALTDPGSGDREAVNSSDPPQLWLEPECSAGLDGQRWGREPWEECDPETCSHSKISTRYVRADLALTAPRGAGEGAKPVAWRVKDFAAGWFYYGLDQMAEATRAELDGARVEPLYTAPPSELQPPCDLEGWRPIESPPADRTMVLLIGAYPTSRVWSDVYSGWAEGGWWTRWPHYFAPSHWRPLLPPPSAPSRDEAKPDGGR